jgi:hypothetical protein
LYALCATLTSTSPYVVSQLQKITCTYDQMAITLPLQEADAGLCIHLLHLVST